MPLTIGPNRRESNRLMTRRESRWPAFGRFNVLQSTVSAWRATWRRHQARAGARTATSSCCAPPRRRAPTTRSPATATAVRRRAARGSPSDQGRQGSPSDQGGKPFRTYLRPAPCPAGHSGNVDPPEKKKGKKERKKPESTGSPPAGEQRSACAVNSSIAARCCPRQERHARRPVCVRRVRHAERQQLRARRLRGLERFHSSSQQRPQAGASTGMLAAPLRLSSLIRGPESAAHGCVLREAAGTAR